MFFRKLARRERYEIDKKSGGYHKYTYYRNAIAEDCNFRCVYCDSHEDNVGGDESMELDHFRPWNKGFGKDNKKVFEHLKHEPTNLVHACKVCNRFKWAYWPTEDPDKNYDHEKGWVDPFLEVRADFLDVGSDGTVFSKKAPGEYQIAKLRLNRPLLKRQREFRLLQHDLIKIEKELQTEIDKDCGSEHARTLVKVLQIFSKIRQLTRA